MKIDSKNILTAAAILGLLVVMSPVYAITSPTNSQVKQTAEQTRMDNLRDRGSKEIDRRLASLDKLSEKLNSLKKLTTGEKTQFSADIANNIAELNSLKTKIAADTDVTTLKADVQSIVNAYRVYALYIPKTHLLSAADIVNQVVTNLTNLGNKLETRITEAEKAGKDVATLKTKLTDMRAKIADATIQANAVNTSVTAANPSGYPANKSVMQTAQANLKTAKEDITAAKHDAEEIIQSLKGINKTSQTPTTGSSNSASIQNNQ